jgi:hypothetical protein
VQGLRVCGLLERVADERISVSDLPTEIEGAGASFDELNDFLVNFIRKALRRGNDIDAITVCGARLRAPCRIRSVGSSVDILLDFHPNVHYLFLSVKTG